MPIRMPRIFAEQAQSPGGVPRQSIPRFTPFRGEGAERVAQLAGGIAEGIEREQAEQIKADNAEMIMKRTTQFEDGLRNKQQEFLSLKGENAKDLDKQAPAYAEQMTEQALEGITDRGVRMALLDQLHAKRNSFLSQMGNHARVERLNTMRQTQLSRIDGLKQDFVTTDSPESEQEIIRNLNLTMQSLGAAQGHSAETIEVNLAGQVSDAVESKVIALAAQDPKRAHQYYKEHESMIAPTSRGGLEDRLIGRIEQEDRKREKIINGKRNTLLGSAPDAEAYMYETGDASQLRNISTGLRSLGFNDEADDIDVAIKANSMGYEMVQRNDGKPFAERLQDVRESMPITTPENAEDILKARTSAEKMIAQQFKTFQKDPAGYADKELPEGLTGENRIRARLERQNQLAKGVPGFQASVLSETEKSLFQRKWEDTENSRDKLDFLMSIENEYGGYAGAAFEDIGIPSSATVAVDLFNMSKGSDADSQLLITAATTKPGDIPTDSAFPEADVKAAITSSDVYSVKARVARMVGSDARYQDSVRELGDTLTNAVRITKNAESATVLDKYLDTIDSDDKLITFDKSRIDGGNIEDALDARKEAIVSASGEDTGLFSRIFGMAQEESTVWIDAPDGNGWVLLNKGSQTLVKSESGEPVRVTEESVVGGM